MKRVGWFGIIALLVVLAGFVGTPQVTQAQVREVRPSAAPPGGLFTFFVDGFLPNEKVGVWINAPDGSVISIVDRKGDILVVQSDSSGLAEWFVVMSEETPAGFYAMVARGIDSGREFVIPFEIDPAAPMPEAFPPPPGSTSGAEPAVGPAGTRFVFFADGFSGNEGIGIWINTPDGSVVSIVDAEGNVVVVDADDEGQAAWATTIPADAPSGYYTMVARGIQSGIQHVIPFEVE